MNRAKWQETEFFVGDVVALGYLIKEKGKERIQPFAGKIIKIRGRGESRTLTLRKIAADRIGVERIVPLNSPQIKNFKVVSHSRKKPKRSKLYYLRSKTGKKKK
ncbi:MAG: 50S ribosomal protein L19 [Candidatus Shapirobacteria bacterium]